MEFHGLDVGTQFKRMRELVPEAYRTFLEFDKKAFKDGAIPAQDEGADRARNRADHPVSVVHRRPHEEVGERGRMGRRDRRDDVRRDGDGGRRGLEPWRARPPVPSGAQGRLAVDLALTEPQEILRASARTFVEREAPPQRWSRHKQASSLAPALWRKASTSAGPASCSRPHTVAARARSPTPPSSSRSWAGAGARPVLQLGRARRADRAGGGDGRRSARSCRRGPRRGDPDAWPSRSRTPRGARRAITLAAQRVGDRYRLDGVKLFVGDATVATHLIVAARTGEAPATSGCCSWTRAAPGVRARGCPASSRRRAR